MKLTDKQYNACAWFGRLFLPSLGTLVGSIGKIWGVIPYCEEIVLTIIAFDVFWNAILGIQSKQYFEDKQIVSAEIVDENVGQG